MVHRRILLFIFLLFIGLCAAPTGFAYVPKEGSITATLGPYYYRTDFKPSQAHPVSPFLFNGALLINGDLSRWGQLEIGVYGMNKRFYRRQNAGVLGERTQVVHISLGYRRWFSEVFSVSTSFYSAYSLGLKSVVYSDFPPGTDIDTSARDVTEYGFDFSAQAELWNRGRWGLILNGHYSLSVTNKPGEKGNHYGALLGLRYFIQEKQIVAKPKDAL